jgi:hypothetical protein
MNHALNIRVVATSAITALILTFAARMIPSNAQSITSVPSGTCGFLMSRNFGGWETSLAGANAINANQVGMINFDTGNISTFANQINNFGGPSAANATQSNPAAAEITTTQSNNFTVSAGPFSGSYYLTFTGQSSPNIVVVPVNGGNTYFLITTNQTDKNPSSAVCQKV